MAQGKRGAQGQGQRPVEDDLVALPGVNMEIAEALHVAGLDTLGDVSRADDKALLAIPGIGPATLAGIRDYLKE